MLGDQELEETKSHSKAFHRAVSAQEKAKKELVKVQTSRRNFLTAWGGYVDKLQSLLKQQLEEQEKTLASFGQHEQKWQQQLVEANKELATFSAQSDGTAQHVSSDSDVDLSTDGPSEDPWSTDNAAKLANRVGGSPFSWQREGRSAFQGGRGQRADASTQGPLRGRCCRGRSAPSQGLGVSQLQPIASRPSWLPGLLIWRHSVVHETDFISPFAAQLLGIQLPLERNLSELGFLHFPLWIDARGDDESTGMAEWDLLLSSQPGASGQFEHCRAVWSALGKLPYGLSPYTPQR